LEQVAASLATLGSMGGCEGRILASLDRCGQQLPVVVVAGGDDGQYILVDGYKRARGLQKLSRLRNQCHTLRIDGPSLRDPSDS